MADISIALSETDLEQTVQMLFGLGCAIVPDARYAAPVYDPIVSQKRFMRVRLSGESLFFIMHKSYSSEPLSMRMQNIKEPYFYYIQQRNGGPDIMLMTSHPDDIPKRIIRVGMLSYYPWYWSVKQEARVPAPDALRDMYKAIVKHIDKGGKKVRLSVHTIHVAADALQRIRSGEATLMLGRTPVSV